MDGKVSSLIARDMSRLGRDYLKVNFYAEVLFVEKGVRLIAINNGIGSANQQASGFTPFLNIIIGCHAKDTSKKIRAVPSRKVLVKAEMCRCTFVCNDIIYKYKSEWRRKPIK